MVLNGCFSVSENNSSAMGASSHPLQIYLSVCVSVCHMCSSARGGQKKVVDALELELQAVGVVNSSVGAENQSGSSRRPVSALNH